MVNLLRKIFPKTKSQFPETEFAAIEAEFFKSFVLPRDAGYFPMLLKQKHFPEMLIQVADFEFLHWQVAQSEELVLRSGGTYAINSTLQWLILESGAALLNKQKGLYALWKFQGQVFESRLSAEEAEKIQELQEHPELMPWEPDSPVLNHLLARGMIKSTSSDS